ncbi:MAG: acetylxylan esterase [Planctomycetota bacterium]|nr:acetylxylan esterase [Planctomycetota bacterium]
MTPQFVKLVAIATCLAALTAQGANYDEGKVPSYQLPNPLATSDDTTLSAEQWQSKRRGEILELFERHMYGRVPKQPVELVFEVHEQDKAALSGLAIRKQVRIRCRRNEREVVLHLLLYLPAKPVARHGSVPLFLGLNFGGNQTLLADPRIELTKSWVRKRKIWGSKNYRAAEVSRGVGSKRWPVEVVLGRGYGIGTIYYGDIDPDFDDNFQNGVHALFPRDKNVKRRPDAWGSIATWAWGLSRALDYLETDAQVDAKRVALVGHSRLGKTSLWAGASDSRFAMVVSNDSGCGGAALSRRRFGETVQRINTSFPHWFCENFKAFNNAEDRLPIDQHMLVALVAPRPVLVCSAVQDRWADPRGEFLAARHAAPVYKLLGTDGIETDSMPEPRKLLKSRIGYYLRPGKHDMTLEDWRAYMDFADHHGLGNDKTPIR